MAAVLNLLIPWITLAVVTFCVITIRNWILRHLFGVSWLASRERNLAVIIYLIALLPGVLLREGSRYFVAGLLRLKPAFIQVTPTVGSDGIVEIRFVHFLVLNPVFAALIALAPFISGLIITYLVAMHGLNVPALMAAATSSQGAAFGTAIQRTLTTPNFLLFAYILFGIANTCLPTSSELRATWFFWVGGVLFLGLLMVAGLYNAIFLILDGPVTRLVYGLATILTVIVGMNLLVAAGLFVLERLVEMITDRKVEYTPAQAAVKTSRAGNVLRSVEDLRLPVPSIPGKDVPIVIAPPVAPPEAPPKIDVPTLPAPAERPAITPPAAAASLPARTTGTGLPAVPERAAPPPPRPAASVPLPPPKIASTPADEPAKAASPLRPPFAPAAKQPTGETKAIPTGASGGTAGGAFPAARTTGETKPPAFGGSGGAAGALSKPLPTAPTPPPLKPPSPAANPPKIGTPFANRDVRPAPKPASGAFNKPTSPADDDVIDAELIEDEDYIDADVIEADVIDEAPPPKPSGGFNKPFGRSPFNATGSKPSGDKKDDDETLKYVDADKL